MRCDKVNLSLIALCAVLFGSVLALTSSLIQERSKDIVRVTVSDKDLLHTAQTLQGVTGKVAYAYPIGVDANAANPSQWRVVIDNNSEANR